MNVPAFLKDRPRSFVNHCMRRLTSSDEISIDAIVQVDSEAGTFKVKSLMSTEWYDVSFGRDNSMPKCMCLDWQSSFMPCKHFLAIMQHFPEWSWNKLPKSYTNSPLFNLDKDVLFGKHSDSQPVVPTTDESAGDDLCTSEPSLELPKKFFPKRSKAAACRALLNQIASLTYLVVDDASLSRLLDALIDMKEDVSSSIPEKREYILSQFF